MRNFLLGLLSGLLFALPGIADASHEEAWVSLLHQNPQNMVARSATPGLTSLYVTPNGPISEGVPAQLVVVDRDLDGGTSDWTEMVSTIGAGEYLTGVQSVGALTDADLRGPWYFRYGHNPPFLTVTSSSRKWDGGLEVNHSVNSFSNALWVTNRHSNATGVGIAVGIGEGLDHRLIDVTRSGQDTSVTLNALHNGSEFPTLALRGAQGEAYLRGSLRLVDLSVLPTCDSNNAGSLAFAAPSLWFCDGTAWRAL